MLKVSFSEIDEAYLRSKVENGYYSSITEVIRDAVRRFRENDRDEYIMAALAEAEEDIQNGRYEPFTRELFDSIVSDALKQVQKDKEN